MLNALAIFGFGKLDIVTEDVLSGKIIQLGFPPFRIDIISKLTGLTPDEIWKSREKGNFGDQTVYIILEKRPSLKTNGPWQGTKI